MPKHGSSSSPSAEAPAKKKPRKKTQTVAALKKQLAQSTEKELIEIIAALVQSKKVTNLDVKIAACANIAKRLITIERIVKKIKRGNGDLYCWNRERDKIEDATTALIAQASFCEEAGDWNVALAFAAPALALARRIPLFAESKIGIIDPHAPRIHNPYRAEAITAISALQRVALQNGGATP